MVTKAVHKNIGRGLLDSQPHTKQMKKVVLILILMLMAGCSTFDVSIEMEATKQPENTPDLPSIDIGAGPTTIPDTSQHVTITETTPSPAVTLGRLAFVSFMNGDLEIDTINTDGTMLTRLTSETMLIMHPAWSPDGEKIAFEACLGGNMSSDCPAGTSFDIYVMDANGSDLTNITNDPSTDRSPSWSPSGEIAFSSDRSGKDEIYVMKDDGSVLTQITDGQTRNYEPQWSPDGKWLAYHCTQELSTKICIQPAEGLDQVIMIDGTVPVWSPLKADGNQRLAFHCWSNGHSDICMARPDGSGLGNLTNSSADEISPSWSPDGQWIAFQSNLYNDISIYKDCVDCESNSIPFRLTGGESIANWPVWSPDGTWIAYLSDGNLSTMRTDGSGQRILLEISLALLSGSRKGVLLWKE